MNPAPVALAALAACVMMCAESGRFTPTTVLTLSILPMIAGYSILDARFGTTTAWLYLGLFCSFLIGERLGFRLWGMARAQHVRAWRSHAHLEGARADIALAAAIASLAYYHLWAVGIPLFSADIELARFDFSGSGLWGLPGRMYLFGLPFAAFLVSIRARVHPTRFLMGARTTVWLLYATAAVLGGLKGGLFKALITGVIARAAVGAPVRLAEVIRPKYIAATIVAMLAAAAISLRYSSLRLGSLGDTWPFMWERITVIAARPGHYVLTKFGTGDASGELFKQDAAYFLQKYFRFRGREPDVAMPLDKTVSASLYGGGFIVPVTVGAPAELVVNLGLWLAVAAMFSFGAAFAYTCSASQRGRRPVDRAAFALGTQFMYVYLLNGGLIYTVLNFALVATLLLLSHGAVACFLSRVPPSGTLTCRALAPLRGTARVIRISAQWAARPRYWCALFERQRHVG